MGKVLRFPILRIKNFFAPGNGGETGTLPLPFLYGPVM